MSVLKATQRLERRDETALTDRRCRRCGYGIAAHAAPRSCPMCGGRLWDDARPVELAAL